MTKSEKLKRRLKCDIQDKALIQSLTVRERTYSLQGLRTEVHPRLGRATIATAIANWLLGDPGEGRLWDHINGDIFDVRRVNLRSVTVRENSWNRKKSKRNTSGYVGVLRASKRTKASRQRWRAVAGSLNKQGQDILVNLGSFSTKEEAARAYDDWVRQNRQDKRGHPVGRLNFPQDGERGFDD